MNNYQLLKTLIESTNNVSDLQSIAIELLDNGNDLSNIENTYNNYK